MRASSSQRPPRGTSTSIRVAVRIRPLSIEEERLGRKFVWRTASSEGRRPRKAATRERETLNEVIEEEEDDDENGARFRFDYVCPPESTTTELYNGFARGVVVGACDGCHGNIFAHGQTGSGKTYTTLGTEQQPGIILLAFSDIFHYIRTHSERKFLLRLGYMEIYNDSVNCLLGDGVDLKPDRATDDGVAVPGLQYEFVRSPADFLSLLLRGERKRKVGHTDLNRRSSRSHAILSVLIESKLKRPAADEESSIRCSVLNLVDLAGSENIGSIGSKQRQTECRHINRSLLGLSRVIVKLGRKPTRAQRHVDQHIPFRDCKLTRILQPALQGNSNSALIATLTPTDEAREESRNTLRFASFTSRIRNHVTVNEKIDTRTELKRCRRMVQELRRELIRYKDRVRNSLNKELMVQQLDEKNSELLQLLQKQNETQSGLMKRIELLQEQLGSTEVKSACSHRAHSGPAPKPSQDDTAAANTANEADTKVALKSGMTLHQPGHDLDVSSSISCSRECSPTISTTRAIQHRVAKLRQMLDEAENNICLLVQQLATTPDARHPGSGLGPGPGSGEPTNERTTDRDHNDTHIDDDNESDGEAREWKSPASIERRLAVQLPLAREHVASRGRAPAAAAVATPVTLVCSEGMGVSKFCNGRLGSHECRLWLDLGDSRLKWCTARIVKGALQGLMCKKLRLDEIKRLSVGSLRSHVFQKNWSDELVKNRGRAVTLTATSRTINVVFHEQAKLDALLGTFQRLLPEVPIDDERIQQHSEGADAT